MAQLGMYILLDRQPQRSLCGPFLCSWSLKQMFVLLFSSVGMCQTRPLCRQRQNKGSPHFHAVLTLTHLPKGLLALCSITLEWLLVVRELESCRFRCPALFLAKEKLSTPCLLHAAWPLHTMDMFVVLLLNCGHRAKPWPSQCQQ